eukprot:1138269-Pelagomonas_calceolata.AAC.2
MQRSVRDWHPIDSQPRKSFEALDKCLIRLHGSGWVDAFDLSKRIQANTSGTLSPCDAWTSSRQGTGVQY